MADFFDKASAIWKALDEMADKSPEAYSTFIQSQLKEGSDLFLSGGGGFGEKSGSTTNPAKKDKANPMDNALLKQLSGLSLSSSLSTSGPRPTLSKQNDKNSIGSSAGDKVDKSDPRTTLLDHDIGGSLLASIIKVKDEDEDEQLEDGQIQLFPHIDWPKNKISGPGSEKKRPLIQEL